MIKILVVDDERTIRRGLIAMMSKNLSDEIEFIEAGNGDEALEKAKENNPHLIITDIRMPGCNGLEFISQLKERQENADVIIISGYEDFGYAQQAIRLGVKEYIMKPVKKVEFVTLVQDYIQKINEKQMKHAKDTEVRIKNLKIIERLRRDLLLGFLQCPTSEEAKKYLEQLEEVGITLKSKLYTCAVIEYQITEENEAYIDFAVKNILDEIFSEKAKSSFVVNVPYEEGSIVTILEGDSQSGLMELSEALVRLGTATLKKHCRTKVYAGLGDVAYDSIQLHISLRHALVAANFKIFEEGDILCSFDNIDQTTKITSPGLLSKLKLSEYNGVFEVLEGMQKLYNIGKCKEGIRCLEQEYEEIHRYMNRKMIKQTSSTLGQQTYKVFSQCWSFYEVKRQIKDRFESLASFEEEAVGNVRLMEDILKYVDEHITDEMDLQTLAEKFHRSQSYISTQFKRCVAGGFSSYLTNKRVDIAKKLLRESSTSITEISEMTGFNNPKYFSVVFKKTTGKTPREFRENS